MGMIVRENKSSIEGMERLYRMLYDMEDNNYELLEIYEQIDEEVESLEDDLYYAKESNYENEHKWLVDELEYIVKNFKKMTRADILRALELLIEDNKF